VTLAARRWIGEVPLLVVCTLLLSAGADILPGSAFIKLGEFQLNLARVLILIGLIAFVYAERPRLPVWQTGLAIPLVLLLVAGLVTTIKWGTEPRYRFLVEAVALFYLTAGLVRARPETRLPILFTALVALALSALAGVTQVAQGDATGFYRKGCTPLTQPGPIAPSGTITRATGGLLNPNVLAGQLLLLAPLATIGAAMATGARQLRLALGLVVGLGYLALVFTFSRAGIFLGILGLGAAVALSTLPHRRYLAGVGVLLAIGVSFLFGSCGSEGVAGYGRTKEWSETIHVIRDNPVYGVGLGRIGDVLRARNPKLRVEHAHNLFLNWWAEAGPAALLAWLWVFGALIWRSLRAARAGDVVAKGAVIAVTGFAAYSLVDHPSNVDRVAIALWITLGLVAGGTPQLRGGRALGSRLFRRPVRA
jgi:O-antigen ligase